MEGSWRKSMLSLLWLQWIPPLKICPLQRSKTFDSYPPKTLDRCEWKDINREALSVVALIFWNSFMKISPHFAFEPSDCRLNGYCYTNLCNYLVHVGIIIIFISYLNKIWYHNLIWDEEFHRKFISFSSLSYVEPFSKFTEDKFHAQNDKRAQFEIPTI